MRLKGIVPRQLSCLTRRITGVQWRPHAEALGAKEGFWDYELNEVRDMGERREMVRDRLKSLPDGVALGAVARCCDSGQALAELVVRSGKTDVKLDLGNLSNSDIAHLRPSHVVYLTSSRTYRVKSEHKRDPEAEMQFIKSVLKSANFDDIHCTVPHAFSVNIIDVGLVWVRDS